MTLKPCPCCKTPQTTRNAKFDGAGELNVRYLSFTCQTCHSSFILLAGKKSVTIQADRQTELVLRELGPHLAMFSVNHIPLVSTAEVWYTGLEGSLDLERKTLVLSGQQKVIDAFLSDYNLLHGVVIDPLEMA